MADMQQFVIELFEKLKLEEQKLLIKEDASFIKHFVSSPFKEEIKSSLSVGLNM